MFEKKPPIETGIVHSENNHENYERESHIISDSVPVRESNDAPKKKK